MGGLTLPELARVTDYVEWYARRTPDAPAAWFAGTSLTWAELARQVDAQARAFVGLGLEKGDRIAVLSTPRIEFLVNWLAAMRVGLVYVGLNPRYTSRELAHVVGDARPSTIIALRHFESSDFEPQVARLRDEFCFVRHTFRLEADPTVGVLEGRTKLQAYASRVDDDRYAARVADVTARDAAAIVYTSGSSGAPKGAVIPHDALVYGPRVAAVAIGLDRPRTICALPTNHIGCLADLCTGVIVAGGMIVFMERFDAGRFLELVEQLRLTSIQHTPTVLQLLTHHPDFRTRDLSSLKLAAWGGAALPTDALRCFRAMKLKLMLAYGQTECISNITWADETFTDEQLTTTIGRPDPNQVVRLVDERMEPVADGEPGEIITRHPAQMLGYFNNPEATAAAFTSDGFLKTGDVAVRLPDGTLRLVGRRSEMFKSGGYNVYPRELELCLEEHPSVALAAVIGIADPLYSEVGVAYVMTKPRAASPSEESLREWCRTRLANYKVPKRFVIRGELPLLPIGKVDKQALKREAASPAVRSA